MSFKITAKQREYFRYSGASAEVKRRGLGSSQPKLALAKRRKQRESSNAPASEVAARTFETVIVQGLLNLFT